MAFPKFNTDAGGMLDSIKSKLGLPDDSGYGGYRGRSRNDNYNDYDDYDDEEYADDYDDADDAPSSNYDPYSPVTTRPARGNHARVSSRTSSTSTGSAYRPAKLVSIDDVRAHTTVPESLNRDPLPPRKVTTSSFGNRTMVDATQPAAANTPNGRAAAAAGKERSESLNALFTSTAEAAGSSDAASKASEAPTQKIARPQASGSSFDPYKAYEGTASGTHSPTRSVTVLKPGSYGECEKVAKALKAGDAVVLALKSTPDALAKRVLDFSFGVSSALDANVDCIADKVFVIARGAGLTDAERANLRNQGIL